MLKKYSKNKETKNKKKLKFIYLNNYNNMMVILFCKGENEVLKTVCFNGTYTQAEDYINNRAEIPEGTTRTLIIPEETYIFNIDESLRRENEAFEQAITQENCRIHERTQKVENKYKPTDEDSYIGGRISFILPYLLFFFLLILFYYLSIWL